MIKKAFIVLFLLANTLIINAQKGWELGVIGGTMHYFGDLNTNFDLTHPGYSATAVARYNFNNRLCARLSATMGTIKGDDAWSKNVFEQRRNLNFRSQINDASLQLEFNFLPYNHGSAQENFTPYLLAGMSVFGYNPTTTYAGKSYELRSLGTEGQFKNEEYSTSGQALLYGGGVKIDLNDKWSLNIEVASRKVFTDFIDDVSGTYPDIRDVKRLRGEAGAALVDRSIEPQIGKAGRQRGNGRNNDSYLTAQVGIVYYFGGLECPSFTRPK
jgi:opacity protein-like surface antigen